MIIRQTNIQGRRIATNNQPESSILSYLLTGFLQSSAAHGWQRKKDFVSRIIEFGSVFISLFRALREGSSSRIVTTGHSASSNPFQDSFWQDLNLDSSLRGLSGSPSSDSALFSICLKNSIFEDNYHTFSRDSAEHYYTSEVTSGTMRRWKMSRKPLCTRRTCESQVATHAWSYAFRHE